MTARDARLIKLYRSGRTLRECGERFGISAVRAHQILVRYGQARRRQGKPSPNQRLDAFIRKASRTIILEPTPETAAIIKRAIAAQREAA